MLHRVGGAMEAVLAERNFIMIDHHQNRMIMQHTRIQTPLLGPPAKCYTISSLFLIKTSTRQLEPAFIQDTN
jgi:hypothetical protein